MLYAKNGPKPVGSYSPVIRFQNLYFISGQISADPITGEIKEDIEQQFRQSLENLRAQVEATGGAMQDVLKVSVFLVDIVDYTKFNDIYTSYFAEPYPAREVVAVTALPKGSRVEISAIVGKE